ncbi:Uncharacterised protein [Mycobacteroides abscessus subsp. abscessus]|uniref:antitoxin VbhA family protein n=1 Tax=Mycobacteroides abscessus TaxID=36809 RepID=UPI000925904D|nr:hypothetical protein [Mycobacteroides abscessus]PVB44491.1 hypothetical protein DDJ39_07615 [Mycobacteroides abscessus]SIL04349.1 Uncharacterised protein [Mycobacteroides abscessus subsp. abscessus]SLE09192.1 Uncharacterised protein [Mycobacteroides abscessus subsp. abscessus]
MATDLRDAQRRGGVVGAIRRSAERQDARSTDATWADQGAYVRGMITAAELIDPVRRRYDAQ